MTILSRDPASKMAALDSPDFAEAREYVRQELAAMGGRALPENELDTYTRGKSLCCRDISLVWNLSVVEFLRLVKEREVTSTPDTTSSTSSSRPHTTSSSTSRSAVYKVRTIPHTNLFSLCYSRSQQQLVTRRTGMTG